MMRDEAREYVERWQKAGPELERVRREELRALTEAEGRELFCSVLELASLHRQIRPSSGLVEQQRIFQKARK
jgi:hypothetical protein